MLFQEVFEISHDGHYFTAEEVLRHETGPNVVMNCAVHSIENRTYLVSGQESHCQLYKVEMAVFEKNIKKEVYENSILKNRKEEKKKNEDFSKSFKSLPKVLTFKIRPLESIQTDFR